MEGVMLDVALVAAGCALFVVAVLYTYGCDRI
jgi:hypothetical protein